MKVSNHGNYFSFADAIDKSIFIELFKYNFFFGHFSVFIFLILWDRKSIIPSLCYLVCREARRRQDPIRGTTKWVYLTASDKA